MRRSAAMLRTAGARRRPASVPPRRQLATGGKPSASSSSSAGGTSSKPSGGGGGPLEWYSRMLDTQPILTKCATSGFMCGAGDVIAQHVVERTDKFDWGRHLRMWTLGGFLVGPALHLWYGALFRMVKAPGMRGALTKTAVDQFTFAPVFIASFFCASATLEGVPGESVARLEGSWWDAVRVNWMMWLPAQAINFFFMPLKYQTLFANFVALFWNTYLSVTANKQQAEIADALPAA